MIENHYVMKYNLVYFLLHHLSSTAPTTTVSKYLNQDLSCSN